MDRAYLATSNQVSVTGVGQEQAAGTPGFLLDSPGVLHRCLNPAVHLLRPVWLSHHSTWLGTGAVSTYLPLPARASLTEPQFTSLLNGPRQGLLLHCT